MKADNDNFAGKRPKIFLNTVILLVHRVFTITYLKKYPIHKEDKTDFSDIKPRKYFKL